MRTLVSRDQGRGEKQIRLTGSEAVLPTAFGESRSEMGSEGLGSGTHDSQPDLRRIVELPAPADFLSLSSETKPKLMTPDAFMTPSTSLQQVCAREGCGIKSWGLGVPHPQATTLILYISTDRRIPQQ